MVDLCCNHLLLIIFIVVRIELIIWGILFYIHFILTMHLSIVTKHRSINHSPLQQTSIQIQIFEEKKIIETIFKGITAIFESKNTIN